MDPLVTSSLISAGSSILGGLFGGKQKRGPSPQEQVNAQALLEQTMLRNRPSWAVEGAKAAGIHPLVALGMSPYQGGASIMAGDTGSGKDVFGALANAGQDVSRAVAAYQTKEQRDMNKSLAALQLERAGLENELLRSQIAGQRAQLAPAIPSDNPSSGTAKDILSALRTPMGWKDGANPMHKVMYDDNGYAYSVFNEEDLGDNDALQYLHAAGYTIPQLVWNYTGAPHMVKGFRKLWFGSKRKWKQRFNN